MELTTRSLPQSSILTEIKERTSPYTFSKQPLEREDLMCILEAARWSPSAKNIQPWRFIYAEKGSEAYDQMLDCVSEKNQKWGKNAALLVVSFYQVQESGGKENFYAMHDLGAATAAMAIEAKRLNIGLHHMGGDEVIECSKSI